MKTEGNIMDVLDEATYVVSPRARVLTRGRSKGRSSHTVHFEHAGRPLCGIRVTGVWQTEAFGPCGCTRCLKKLGL